MTKVDVKKRAIELRKQGYSYSYIVKQISVSKSTLSLWLRDVSYKPNHFTLTSIKKASDNAIAFKKAIKHKSEVLAHKEAVAEIGNFTKRDLFILGIGLYLGEGSKINIIRVTNSDPKIINLAIHWFKKIYNLQNSNFKIRIHLYPDCDEQKTLVFWSKETKLPTSCFHSSWVDRRTDKKSKNKGKLPFGTAHLTIKSNGDPMLGRSFLRKILALIDISIEKSGTS
jgi:hypothetical protein